MGHTSKVEDTLFVQIKQLLDDARSHIARTVNTAIVKTYWQIGKYIVEYEQEGNLRAEFGKDVINNLSKRLIAEYGKGFSPANIRYMRQFYTCSPFCHALSDKLSWPHWRTLNKINDYRLTFNDNQLDS